MMVKKPMKLDCQIKQYFYMCEERATCNATINLVSEKIVLVEESSFDELEEFEQLSKVLGEERLEAHITCGSETNIFVVEKFSTHSFKIGRNDMEKFKNFKNALLFHDKLNSDLDDNKTERNLKKI